MTSPVTDLSCMDGENLAAIALQLQETALETEQRLYGLEKRLRSALNRPTVIQTCTTLVTGIPTTGADIGPSGSGVYNITFDNTGIGSSIDSSTREYTRMLGPGLYEIGIFANAIASGAVDDNSFRAFRIGINGADPTAPNGEALRIRSELLLSETNTGIGVDACVTGEFQLTEQDRIQFLLAHGNASSTLNVSVGAIVWLSKISDSDSVVVL